MHEAKTRLSQLVRAAEAGERVILSRAGKPVAELKPITSKRKAPLAKRRLGLLAGKLAMAQDFNAPLAEDFWLGKPLP